MGMSDTLLVDDNCPSCGHNGEIRIQHKWGLVTEALQHVGDKIRWPSTDNEVRLLSIRGYTGGTPANRSLLVVGYIAGCKNCPSSKIKKVLIDIQDDQIQKVYFSLNSEQATAFFKIIAESENFIIWENGYLNKDHSLATLASFRPALMRDYMTWLTDMNFKWRRELLGVIQVVINELRDEERLIARVGRDIGPRDLRYIGAAKAAGLEDMRNRVIEIAANTNDPLNNWAKSLLRDFPEKDSHSE